jgi:hypothetical protein
MSICTAGSRTYSDVSVWHQGRAQAVAVVVQGQGLSMGHVLFVGWVDRGCSALFRITVHMSIGHDSMSLPPPPLETHARLAGYGGAARPLYALLWRACKTVHRAYHMCVSCDHAMPPTPPCNPCQRLQAKLSPAFLFYASTPPPPQPLSPPAGYGGAA